MLSEPSIATTSSSDTGCAAGAAVGCRQSAAALQAPASRGLLTRSSMSCKCSAESAATLCHVSADMNMPNWLCNSPPAKTEKLAGSNALENGHRNFGRLASHLRRARGNFADGESLRRYGGECLCARLDRSGCQRRGLPDAKE